MLVRRRTAGLLPCPHSIRDVGATQDRRAPALPPLNPGCWCDAGPQGSCPAPAQSAMLVRRRTAGLRPAPTQSGMLVRRRTAGLLPCPHSIRDVGATQDRRAPPCPHSIRDVGATQDRRAPALPPPLNLGEGCWCATQDRRAPALHDCRIVDARVRVGPSGSGRLHRRRERHGGRAEPCGPRRTLIANRVGRPGRSCVAPMSRTTRGGRSPAVLRRTFDREPSRPSGQVLRCTNVANETGAGRSPASWFHQHRGRHGGRAEPFTPPAANPDACSGCSPCRAARPRPPAAPNRSGRGDRRSGSRRAG